MPVFFNLHFQKNILRKSPAIYETLHYSSSFMM